MALTSCMTPNARKIVYLIESLFPGGAEHALLRLASALDRSRWQPEVWLLRQGGELWADFAEQGITVRDYSHWDWSPLAPVVKATAIRSALRLACGRVRIVHSFAWDSCATEAAAATLAGIPGYVARIATATPQGDPAAWAYKLCLADRVVVLSEFSKRQVLALYPGVEPKLRVVPNGVDSQRFAPCSQTQNDIRRSLGALPDEVLFVCVARMFPDKNHAFLLHAFQKLLAAGNTPTRLLLLGVGGARDRLVSLSAQLGIADRVQFLGFWRDVGQVLSGCDAFVLPSKAPDDGGIEGMSNATLEAMSVGLPVVMTRNGSEEIVRSGHEGFVVDASDDRELVSAMAALCQSAELRQTMGAAALARVKEHYNLAATIRKYDEIYRELLELAPGRSRFARIRKAMDGWRRMRYAPTRQWRDCFGGGAKKAPQREDGANANSGYVEQPNRGRTIIGTDFRGRRVSLPCLTLLVSCRSSNPETRRRPSSFCRWSMTSCASWPRRVWLRSGRARLCRRRRSYTRRICGC